MPGNFLREGVGRGTQWAKWAKNSVLMGIYILMGKKKYEAHKKITYLSSYKKCYQEEQSRGTTIPYFKLQYKHIVMKQYGTDIKSNT